MEKYETTVHVITKGENAFDAGEMAGRLIDIERMVEDMVVSCEPTCPVIPWRGKKARVKKYETTVHIITEGENAFDAGERAGELVDIRKMVTNMVVSCEPTRPAIVRPVRLKVERKQDSQYIKQEITR